MPAAWSLASTSPGISVGIGDDRRHHRLHRRQPQRELAGIMLDEDADEALERADDRPVEHDRPVLGAVLADVAGVEPLGQHRVGLDGADLPGAADGVGQMEFELGRVEGALAGQFLPAEFLGVAAGGGDGVAQRLLGPVPHLRRVPKRLSGRSASLIA